MLIIIDSSVSVLVPQSFIRLDQGGFVVGWFFGVCFVVSFFSFPSCSYLIKLQHKALSYS